MLSAEVAGRRKGLSRVVKKGKIWVVGGWRRSIVPVS